MAEELRNVCNRIFDINCEIERIESHKTVLNSRAEALFDNIVFIIKSLHQKNGELELDLGYKLEGTIGSSVIVYADEKVQLGMRTWRPDTHAAPFLDSTLATTSVIVILTESQETIFCVARDGGPSGKIRVERYLSGCWERYIHDDLKYRAELNEAEKRLTRTKEEYAKKYSRIDDAKYFQDIV